MASFEAKSIIVSRKPVKGKEDLWSVMIALFNDNNPHLKGRVPSKVIEYKEVEKVRVKELRNISFYLMGNDLVVNNLTKADIGLEKGIVTVTGKQKL